MYHIRTLRSLIYSFLTELSRQQCQSSDIQSRKQLLNKQTHTTKLSYVSARTVIAGAYHDPDIPDDGYGLGEGPPPRLRGPFGLVSRADLVEGEADEQQTDDGVQVVLDRTAAGVLGFYPVDDGAER